MPPEIAIAQFIAYVTLTLSGLTVAIVSLRFSYRQNFGWDPLLMVTTHGIRSDHEGHKVIYAMIEFETWNRRAYPVVIRSINLKFEDLRFVVLRKFNGKDPNWHYDSSGRGTYLESHVLEGGEHLRMKFEAPFDGSLSLDAIDSMVDIEVICFDPRRNKVQVLHQRHRYRLKK